MSSERVHKLLYVPAFFALMVLISFSTYMLHALAGLKAVDSLMLDITAFARIGYLILMVIMALPFIKSNKILFLVPINAIFNLHDNASTVFCSLFCENYVAVPIGSFPGLWNPLMMTLLDISGLVLLMLRLYGYWQERRAGKRTKF